MGLWDAGWGWCEKNPTFLCIGWYKKSHNGVAEKSHKKYHREKFIVWDVGWDRMLILARVARISRNRHFKKYSE